MTKLFRQFSLIIVFVFYAVLLSSVGAVISQSILSFGISKDAASILEGFKDIPAVIISFFAAAIAYKFGYRNLIIAALGATIIACIIMPLFPSFMTAKIMFVIVGISFVLVKVSVYPVIGIITDDKKQHAALTSVLEGMFMVGVLLGAWFFALFVDDIHQNSRNWLNAYWWLAGVSFVCILIWFFNKFAPIKIENEQKFSTSFSSLKAMFSYSFSIFFLLGIALYVLIEQGISTWLPTFNREVLHLNPSLAIKVLSISASASALGRLSFGAVLRHFNWFKPILAAIFIAMALVIAAVFMPVQSAKSIATWAQAPIGLFLLPSVGFFIAPIYPTLNSIILSSIPENQQASMTALIIAFSAMGSTFGSVIIGRIFGHVGGQYAFLALLLPLSLLVIILHQLKKHIQ